MLLAVSFSDQTSVAGLLVAVGIGIGLPIGFVGVVAGLVGPRSRAGCRLGAVGSTIGLGVAVSVLWLEGRIGAGLEYGLLFSPLGVGGLAMLLSWRKGKETKFTPVTFPDRTALERAVDLLKGRFSLPSTEPSNHLLPEWVVGLLVKHQVPFTRGPGPAR